MREVAPTRSSALELADERKLMRQGYEFLDEKRTLLAGEMLRQLALYQRLAGALVEQAASAARALAAAVERHGLDNLQVYPVPSTPPKQAPGARTSFLGVSLVAAPPPSPASEPPSALDPSPEVAACRAAFEDLLSIAAEVGAATGNLQRLAREYRRTDRRAKALENVLLPELQETIKSIDEQLDTLDREEAMHARWSSGAKTGLR
jgi:V/A-type H+-transporting ATPase subunit D